MIATGDEDGVVRLFDIRKKNPVDELLIDDGKGILLKSFNKWKL